MEHLTAQVATFEQIKSLCTNYKKDSASRKTTTYLEQRLSNLEELWEEFNERHESALNSIEDKSTVSYFVNDTYGKTELMYHSVKQNMMALLMANQKQRPNLDVNLTDMLQDRTDEKIKELMSQQEARFKALNRTMLKINLQFVTEKWEIEDYLSILKTKFEGIEKIHWDIDAVLKDKNLKEEYNQRFEDIEQRYDNLRKALHSKMWSNVHYHRATPQIDIPEFSGNYIQWISFKNIFLETIHDNPTIPKAQKMQHLLTKLKGEAGRLVQHLSINSDNYDSCWEMLTHRYDNRRLQFTSFMNTMQQLPVIQQPNAYNLKRMYDSITESLNGLANMGTEVSSWGPIIVHYMSQKLDSPTFNEYIKDMQNNRELPNLQEFLSFLESKFIAYETVKNCQRDTSNPQKQFSIKTYGKPTNKNYFGNTNSNFKSHNNKNNYAKKTTLYEGNKEASKAFHMSYGQCPLCDGDHVLMQCEKFINQDSAHRNKTVAKIKVCKNCLFSHGDANCTSLKTCKECNAKHHTLLHMNKQNFETSGKNFGNNIQSRPSTSTQQSINHLSASDTEVLLTTVQVQIKAINGTYITMRALLDQGSQVNLITENAAQQLRLPRSKVHATVSGVGSVAGSCKGRVNLNCKSIHSDYNFDIQALVLQKLTNNLPNYTFGNGNWAHLENLKLADPEFNVSRSIDLLLGAEVYSEIILDGVLKGNNNSPTAQQTNLGWILCGKLNTFACYVTLFDAADLSRYWESEDITQSPADINQEDQCELYYRETTKRGPDGKYIVKMPMIQNFEEKLGKSKPTAISQYLQLEKRLRRNEKLSLMYKDFINEYLQLQHMKPTASRITSHNNNECFLPHHGVLRENSTTTKLRVVFNASQINSSGKSLNSLMEKGPNLQKDIQDLILKWRTYKYVFTADIEKMYRCIWIDEEQQKLQKIIWRTSPAEMLQEYALCTVTYGTKCAPWLAMRTLKQLAIDERHKHPDAASILENEFYVDDVISGHNNLETAKMLQTELIQLLAKGGMNLRKWSSNNSALLEQLNEDQIVKSNFDFKQEESMKTLGLGWNSQSDTFTFGWKLKENSKKTLTKRTLLSQISQLYDPMGWLSPITVTAKLIFQRIWTEKLEWDEALPVDIQNHWIKLRTELTEIKTIKLNRWIGSHNNNIELFGFCDASEKAYSCVIYTRTTNESKQPLITLLTAKTRVAPLAQKLSLPRLELCGALLLSRLIEKVTKALQGFNISTWAWSDSKVVLAWLQGEASKYERYVENRVVNIREVIPASRWSYIESKYNPADCATRGLYPKKLLSTSLWWTGPAMLNTFKGTENPLNCLFTTNIEEKQVATTLMRPDDNIINNLLRKHSSLTTVIRVIAWILRFCKNARSYNKTMKKNDTARHTCLYYLKTMELNEAMNIITKNVQRQEIETEYLLLLKNQPLPNKNQICKLNPYLDKDGIMRVGGRLNKTNLPAGMKNPAILSKNGRLTLLIINQAHAMTLHGGARLTLAYIRQQFWILSGNRSVKTELRKCVRCQRFNSTETHQIMADLPTPRVTASRPFTHTGVDFTGHVDVKLNKGRGVKTSKGYIAIFVCMATKAVHIELVSDLSTEAFILAFQRLCSRRGTPQHVYSDCGTNFIGASRMLNNEYELFKKELSSDFFNEIGKMKVEWHFNAPAWPTAGGLWEAAVRSMKHHLRRVLGDQKLTYEEFSTLLSKIEACMNSRPLCPLTEDPEEFQHYLTPGHFLSGSPTMTLPISDYEDDRHLNLRKRWQLTEHMYQRFWKIWSNDYLTSLQARSKWKTATEDIKKDDIVLIRENNLPPGKWAMGRVIEVHRGSDNHVRVTTIKTQCGIIKRPITKLSLLPIEIENKQTEDSAKQNINQVNCNISTPNLKQNKTGKRNFFTMFTTLLTILMLIMGSNGLSSGEVKGNVEVISLGRSRPIYYDTIGKVQLIHDEWRLLMYYNLTAYWKGVEQLDIYLQGLRTICEKIDPRYCETTLHQLTHERETLHYYNNVLLAPHKQLSGRNKRGLIDGVGYVANNLFGILDQRFADQYQADIQAVKNNEAYLLELIKNQTSIVELENETLKRNEDNINRQFNVINNFMNQTDVRFASIQSNIEITMATSFLSSASLTAYLLLTNLRNIQETLYDTLVDIYKGHMNVQLLTPVKLIEQLERISGRLPKTLSLPMHNMQNDVKELYKLLYVRARITDNYFMFEIHIPLASDEDYVIYEVIPLPLKNPQTKEETLTVISTKYIAVNLEKNTYTILNQMDMNHCIQRNTDNYVCILNLPIYNLQNSNAPCEAKLIGHQTTSPCTGKKMKCNTNWIELHTTNTWLAVCCDVCTFRTVCAGDVRSIVINASSIVSLREGCLIQTKDMTIYSHNNYDSQANIDYGIELPSLNKSINGIIGAHQTFQIEIMEDKTINDVKTDIENLKLNETKLPNVVTTHDIHQFVICYALLAVIIIATIIWTIKKRGFCTKTKATGLQQHYEDVEQPPASTNIQKMFQSRSAAGARTNSEHLRGAAPSASGATGRGNYARPNSRREPNLATDVEFKF